MSKTCETCRYWSEMIAEAGGGRPGVRAMCLSTGSPQHGRYTGQRQTCAEWADAPLGAIDSPDFLRWGYSGPDAYAEALAEAAEAQEAIADLLEQLDDMDDSHDPR